MFALIETLFAISLLKKSPKDLPYSHRVWGLLFVTDILITALVLKIQNHWLTSLLSAVFGTTLITVFAMMSLFFFRKSTRFYQTSSALLGTDAIISFCALPSVATWSLGQGGLLVILMMIAIVFWQWLVIAHIMRTALAQSFLFTLGLAFLYLLTAYSLSHYFFPSIA